MRMGVELFLIMTVAVVIVWKIVIWIGGKLLLKSGKNDSGDSYDAAMDAAGALMESTKNDSGRKSSEAED